MKTYLHKLCQDSTISYTWENSKLYSIASKYFSISTNNPISSWVAFCYILFLFGFIFKTLCVISKQKKEINFTIRHTDSRSPEDVYTFSEIQYTSPAPFWDCKNYCCQIDCTDSTQKALAIQQKNRYFLRFHNDSRNVLVNISRDLEIEWCQLNSYVILKQSLWFWWLLLWTALFDEPT